MNRFIVCAASVMALCCCVVQLQANNLVFNGDFQQGNTGFATDYGYATDDTAPGQYGIVNNPYTSGFLGSRATPYFDHTTGGTDGLMMCVDGDGPSLLVWGSTCSVASDTLYNFTCWVSTTTPMSVEDNQLATLQLTFNGSNGYGFTAPDATAQWQSYSTQWYSGDSTSVALAIVDTNTAGGGNDFALDDISLSAVPEPSSVALLGICTAGLLGYAWRRRAVRRH